MPTPSPKPTPKSARKKARAVAADKTAADKTVRRSVPKTSSAPEAPAPARLRCHVISNTHWDREWRYPFQAYRMDLVDLMDRLLDILETRKGYRAFFLDSQTVILEDYLEIRPENGGRIQRLVEADKLQIGPWYTLPDEWGCPGEALVRNLLIGHRVGKRFGPIQKVGYTPFSNGQISQLPQLYQGFGIDSCFFYRGVGKHVAKQEFLWESPDGSRVYGFRFGDYARYNYYYLFYRPGLLGRGLTERVYEWSPADVPWRVANEQSQDRQYGWLNQKLRVHEDRLDEAVRETREKSVEGTSTSQILYMMGHDHSFAAAEEIDLIEAAQAHLDPAKEELIHGALNDYMDAFRQEAARAGLDTLRGEMRHTNKIGLWTNLMAMILSTRLYLKQQNARVNDKVLFRAEPLAAFAWLTGSEYPARFLEIVWKKLLVNQAHDAVGGCSVDRVHEEMLARWGEVDTIADELIRRSMRDVAGRIDGSKIDPRDLQLTVFNTLPHSRSGVAEFIIDLPAGSSANPAGGSTSNPDASFSLETVDGKKVPVQILSDESYTATIEGGYELPMPFAVRRLHVAARIADAPALGYEALVVRPGRKPNTGGRSIVVSERELENECLRVRVNDNGTFCLTDKRSGRVADGLGHFEDTSECGDPWNRVVAENDKPILSLNRKAKIVVEENGPLIGSLGVSLSLSVPAARGEGKNRSKTQVEIPIAIRVALRKGSPVCEATVRLTNTAKDHRLRILFPTDIQKAEYATAESQFDVIERPIRLPDPTGWKEPPYPTNPMWNFVDVSDGKHGFAVLNDGLIEYEAVDDKPRTLAITLIRAFGKFVFDRPTPGSQCLGEQVYRFALAPHAGDWEAGALFEKKLDFLVPFQAILSAPTRGDRPARAEFLSLSPEGCVFSGVKQGEDGKTAVVRFWNPSDRDREVTLTTERRIGSAEELTLEEKPVRRLTVEGGRSVRIAAGKKRIVTVGVRFR